MRRRQRINILKKILALFSGSTFGLNHE